MGIKEENQLDLIDSIKQMDIVQAMENVKGVLGRIGPIECIQDVMERENDEAFKSELKQQLNVTEVLNEKLRSEMSSFSQVSEKEYENQGKLFKELQTKSVY